MASNSKPIAIPKRKQKVLRRVFGSIDSVASSSVSSSKGFATSYGSYGSLASSPSSSLSRSQARKRESLMSAAFCEADYTVINVGDEESPQLITCVKASQGFDWNQEMFLPSHYHTNNDLERRPDPVEDIILTDEEVERMLPA